MVEIKYMTFDGKHHAIALSENEVIGFLITATANGATITAVERI